MQTELSIGMLFPIVLGVGILVIGTTNLRRYIYIQKLGNIFDGRIVGCIHRQLSNSKGQLIQNYYELKVQYRNNNIGTTTTINSTMQYEQDNIIKLIKHGEQIEPYNERHVSLFNSTMIILIGICIAIFQPLSIFYGFREGSIALVCALELTGVVMMVLYIKSSNKRLTNIKGTIVNILAYETGRGKRWTKTVTSYYPIIKVEIEGVLREFQSKYNSSMESNYKIGSDISLYWDEDNKEIVEKKQSILLLVVACVVFVLAQIGLLNILTSI